MLAAIAATIVIGYLLGNLNGSVLISRLVVHDDVRRHGSGNAGFTNFFRIYGGINSLIVMLIDGLKAAAACLIGGLLMEQYGLRLEGMAAAALAVSLGHDFPALLGFRGGKGIVSGFAALIVIDWRIALAVFAVFAVVYLSTYYVSLSSIMGAVTYGAGFVIVYHSRPVVMVLGLAVACLAVFMHRENIVRLAKGTERKTNFFRKGN